MDFGITFNQAIALIIGTGILVGTLLIFGWKNKDKNNGKQYFIAGVCVKCNHKDSDHSDQNKGECNYCDCDSLESWG